MADKLSTIGVLVKTARKSARLTLPQVIANLLGEDCGNNLKLDLEKSAIASIFVLRSPKINPPQI
jgi:hypothetical protein